jgi:polar amino acid transport system substrate-binding protein
MRSSIGISLALTCFALLGACATTDVAPPTDAVRELAPSGRLRAAINLGNGVLAQKDAASGELRGISVELSRELARRLKVPVELIPFDAAGKVTAAATSGAWDIAFVAIDPARATEIAFTAPYVIIEGAYLVPASSPLRTNEDVDRDGVRIAVSNRSAYDLYLARALKRAQLVRAPSPPASMEMFVRDRLEAAAGVKQPLVEFAKNDANYRVIPGRFMVIEQAMGMPRGGERGARYLREFVEDVKASGFVARALERTGQRDAAVAPPAPKP